MATLHHHRPISVSVLSPLSRLRPSSAIPATLFSRSPLSGLMCAPISARAIRDKRLLGPLRGCATSDSAISPGPPPSSRIFIKGLSSSTSEGFLAKTFSSFGEVKKIKIITSKSSKQSLGLAYIWFAHEQDALMAVKEMNGKFLDGRFIAVTIAEAESPSKQNWFGYYNISPAFIQFFRKQPELLVMELLHLLPGISVGPMNISPCSEVKPN
ncbi:hypothetical protein MUK42_06746 [Musa troglodytarum]|uniref:RRM domain-containing protein n=1 Tax=Musa troglodytarum TaxID=320322 RepID=A0A9E7L883_9LILI|nr:hypothetical protein MUK42_06746 [Musa troglodytarum]